MVRRTVPGATVIDAVDDPRFATVVDVPVTIYGHLLECEAAGLDGMWVYTSCASTFWEPNRHLGMPLTRLRALGLLLWWHHTPVCCTGPSTSGSISSRATSSIPTPTPRLTWLSLR